MAQSRREAPIRRQAVLHVVGVAHHRCRRRQPLFDAEQRRADRRRRNQIRIGVRAADAAFDALTGEIRAAAGHEAEGGGAIVHAPGRGGGRPRAAHQPRVAVHRRREHGEEHRHIGAEAAQRPTRLVSGRRVAFGPGEHVLAGAVQQGEMIVAALPGVVHRPLRHERGHKAPRLEERFGEGLEQGRPVRGFKAVGGFQGRLPHARAGLAMQALERHPKVRAVAQQRLEHLGVGRHPQHRIAEVPRRERFQIPVALLAHAGRRFLEHEQLVFEPGPHGEAVALGAFEHAPQHGARAQRVVAAVVAGELAHEVRRAAGQRPFGGTDEAIAGVRKAAVPASEGALAKALVEDVVHVPTEYAVAETTILGAQALQLAGTHELAAQHAVDIRQAEHPRLLASVRRTNAGCGVIAHSRLLRPLTRVLACRRQLYRTPRHRDGWRQARARPICG